MEHNPISMGDLAYEEARRNAGSLGAVVRRLNDLEQYVDYLKQVIEILVVNSNIPESEFDFPVKKSDDQKTGQ